MHQFKCEADHKCISDIRKCDGKEDCTDGADEKDCGKFHHNYLVYAAEKFTEKYICGNDCHSIFTLSCCSDLI
jgi:hypothetical protein